MLKVIDAYVKHFRPSGKFLGMFCKEGKLYISFDTHTDIAYFDGNILVVKEGGACHG